MQVIEKVKVVPEGYNGAGMNYDGGDADDDIRKELSDLKAELAVTKAIRPYQDKLIQCEMEKMFTAGINYTDRKTCNVIYGVVTLPNEPTVTGLVGRNACGCLPYGFTQPASGTPAQ